MFTALRRLVPLLNAALAAVTLLTPLWAQAQGQTQTQASEATLDEVVVTARKREETLLDVPVTENAFTEQMIHSAGIESPRDFVALVPNMTLVEVQNVGNSFITIRGISQARNSEPSVAVLVDGVLEPNPYEFDQQLTDIESIEVLKGPQGAFYGRNAIGGAIIIRTADPPDHFEGTVKAGVGNGVSENGQLALGGPIDSAGTLGYRASLNYYNTDGLSARTPTSVARPTRTGTTPGGCGCCGNPPTTGQRDLRVFLDHVETHRLLLHHSA